MKKYQAVLFLFLLSFFACKEETDQILSPNQLAVGAYIKIDSVISNEFNYAAITSSSIGWMVHGVGEPITTVVSYASATNSPDKATWRKIKETPIADNKATITVTGQELATALGIEPTALEPGNQYIVFNEVVTNSGKTYSIVNTNGELESAADYSMAFRLAGTITCPFDPTGFAGDFEVVADQWEDFSPGDIVKVTAATANTITLEAYPGPAFGGMNLQPMTVKINPANGRVTVDQQVYGDYGSATKYSARSATTRPSYIFSCSGDVILYLIHSAGSDIGTYLLRLKKV